MKTILVTGGCGFIGSHTSLVLLNNGYRVIIFDSNINSSEKVLKKIHKLVDVFGNKSCEELSFIKGDIRDKNLVESIFKNARKHNQEIIAVIHFAGLKYLEESIIKPLEYWDVNVNGTQVLLQVMKNNRCFNFIYSSSASIYGLSLNKGIKEENLINPINPYGASKAATEKMLDNLYHSNPEKWRILKLRYFNPAGAHHSGILGEEPKKEYSNLFPKLAKIAFGDQSKLEIYGRNWPTKDGTCIRDYIHIEDLAEAHYESLVHLLNNKTQNIAFNLGSGEGLTLLEIIKKYSLVNNCHIPYIFKKKRNGDVPILFADINLVKRKLGWKPKRNIENICRDSWLWQYKNLSEIK